MRLSNRITAVLLIDMSTNRKDSTPVLKSLSFSLDGGQKLGIVGRTGRFVPVTKLFIRTQSDLISVARAL